MKYLLCGFVALAFSACASMPMMNQCQYMDWRSAGRESAKSGGEESSLAALKQMCGQQGVIVDERAFREGHAQGLRELCSYKGGFELGMQGKEYSGSCPANLSEDFIRGFREGSREYRERESVKNEERQDSEAAEQMRQHRLKREALHDGYGRSCTFSSDCEIKDTCVADHCGGNGKSCNFDSDCTVAGRCESETIHSPDGYKSVQLCRYR